MNGSQHTIDGAPIPNSKFPDLKGMVAKAHELGLLPGHYMNHCGCTEWMFTDETAATRGREADGGVPTHRGGLPVMSQTTGTAAGCRLARSLPPCAPPPTPLHTPQQNHAT